MLRAVAFVALAAVLCTLGCGDDDSASRSRVDTKASTVAQGQAMREPIVTKKYLEDLVGEPDAAGDYEQEYRYWDYAFDFGDRQYRVRVYTDEPETAYVDRREGLGVLQPENQSERANLRAMRRHLRTDAWPRIAIHTFAGDEGYKPLSLD